MRKVIAVCLGVVTASVGCSSSSDSPTSTTDALAAGADASTVETDTAAPAVESSVAEGGEIGTGDGVGLTVTQGSTSFKMEAGSVITFKYLKSKGEIDAKTALDTDKIVGCVLRASGPKSVGVGLTVSFNFRMPSGGIEEKLVGDVRGKPLVSSQGDAQFSMMPAYLQVDNKTGLTAATTTKFDVNLTSAGGPLKGTITSATGTSAPVTEIKLDLP